MTPFLWKRCFLTWVKKWVLLTVFLKSCVFWRHYFIVFSAKHSFSKAKTVCWKKTDFFMKNSGLFLNMAKWCLWGLLFWGFNVIVVCFWCVWHSARSVKNACFSQFGGFSGVAYSCFLGFARFRCFCVFKGLFLFFVLLLFLFCLHCLCFVVGLFMVLVLVLLFLFFLFFFSDFSFLFFGEGLRVRWGGPKGHLTWT